MGEIMTADMSVTFKVSEEMAKWIGHSAFTIDKSKSEVIRACILLSLDTIINCPSLVHRIQFEDRKAITQ